MGNMIHDETSVLHKLLLEHWSSLLILILIFNFIRFASYWQGHRNSRTPITAGCNSPFPHDRYTTTLGTTSPTLYEQCVGSLTSHRIYICKDCETGPTVYRPYPRRLESLTVCRCLYKGSTFSSVI